MNKKELIILPKYIKKILFYVNNIHWSNNLRKKRLVINNRIVKKHLNSISSNIEDHKKAISIFRQIYKSDNEDNKPFIVEYLSSLKKYNNNRTLKNYNQYSSFLDNFKEAYDINIFEFNKKYTNNTNDQLELKNSLEIYFITNGKIIVENHYNKIFDNLFKKKNVYKNKLSETTTTNSFSFSESTDEVVILENLELALLSILYLNNGSLVNKYHLLSILKIVKRMIVTKSFNMSMSNLLNLDCFKSIILDYGPTHPILNKNEFWNNELDWDKLYIYDIFEEIESKILLDDSIINNYEWNEIPWKDNKATISLYNLIHTLLNLFYSIHYISNHILTQSQNIVDSYNKLIHNKKKYTKEISKINKRITSSVYLLNYRKKLNISFLFNLRSIYPTNTYYIALLHNNDNTLNLLKRIQQLFFKKIQKKVILKDFIKNLIKSKNEYIDIEKYSPFIKSLYIQINLLSKKDNKNELDEEIINILHYINKYIEYFESQNILNNNIINIWKTTKNQLVHNYLSIVINAARDEYYSNKQVQLIELIQEGYIALMASVDQFEPDLGYSFNTYCTFWIHQAIQKNSSILSNNSTTPNNKETSSSTKLVSTDVPMFTSPHNIIGDYIEEDNSNNQEITESQLTMLKNSIDWLPPSITTLLSMRYGIYPFKKHTLEEVGNLFSVNGETIRYIIRIALKKFQEINKSTDTHINEWIKQIKDHTF